MSEHFSEQLLHQENEERKNISSTPFSAETSKELSDLGLEAEDIEAIGKCRGSVQKKIRSLVGDKYERRVINLERKIKKEKGAYLEYSRSILRDKLQNQDLFDRYLKFCGENLERWQFITQNVLNQDKIIIEAVAGLVDDFGGNLEKFQKVIDILTKSRKDMLRYQNPRRREVPNLDRDDRANMDKAIITISKQKDTYEGDPEILEIYADLASSTFNNAEHTIRDLVEAKEMHSNNKVLLRACTRVLKTPEMHWGPYYTVGGFGRFKLFKKAKPIFKDDPELASDVADICSGDTLTEYLERTIDALLESEELFVGDLQKRKQFVKLAQMGGEHTGESAVRLLAKMNTSHAESNQNFTRMYELILPLCYRRDSSRPRDFFSGSVGNEELKAISVLQILLCNEQIGKQGVEGLKTAIENVKMSSPSFPKPL